MARWISMVEANIADPSREDEFHAWYAQTHLPDVLSTPGYVAARRFIAKEPRYGRGRFLTIFEIETDDIARTMAVRSERRAQEKAQGRSYDVMVPNLVVPVWRDVLYEQIHELGGEQKGNWINSVEMYCADRAREDQLNDWYDNIHLPDVLSSPGFLAARRFKSRRPVNGRGQYLATYEIASDDIDATMATRRARRQQEQARSVDAIVPGAMLVVWADVLFQQIFFIRT